MTTIWGNEMSAESTRKNPETPFGIRLRAARKMAGLSMEELAAKLGGRVTKQAISKYETGQMMPSPEVLAELLEALKIATWGASPLRVEDAVFERELPFEALTLNEKIAGLPRMALRRRGLLSLLKKDKDEARPKEAAVPKEALLHLRQVSDMTPLSRRLAERAPTRPEETLRAIITEHEDGFGLADRRARYLAAWHSDAAVSEIRFRAGEKLSAKTESALKYRIADHLQRYLELESVLGFSAAFENPLAGKSVRTQEDVEAAALEVRKRWELGSGPVVNLLGLLEEKGIKVYEAKGIEGFEGLSGRFGLCPFVAVSADFPADRIRFTAAHELGHVICDFPEQESPEGECHAFGAAFLMPRAALEKVFTPARRKVTLGELGEVKATFGVSLQAIMHRAHALGLVSDRQLRGFRERIKARGWAVEEPVAYTSPERATRFKRMLHYAVASGIMDVARAAEIAGVTAEELEKEIGEIF
jgi:Zn-dependent peptidase ImmA (M78 family)/transcriptional regulator with XRE-family HTH domain